MGILLGTIGMFGVLVCFALIIVEGIKRKPVKKIALSLLVFFIVFIVGCVMSANDEKDNTSSQPTVTPETSTEVQTEISTEASTETTSEIQKEEITEESSTSEGERNDTETSQSTESKLSFVLGEDVGEYGKEVTLNAGTEFEEIEIMFYIPAGSYTVTNNSSAAVQLTVYSGGPESDGEWESLVADDSCPKPVVIMAGETGNFEISEGQFLVLSDGSENILFEMK
jgi:hypothetical protein